MKETKKFTGKLEKITRLVGAAGDLQIIVDGKIFYKRTWRGEDKKLRKAYRRRLKRLKGEEITVSYQEINLPVSDYLAEKLFWKMCGSKKIPKRHNDVMSIDYRFK